MCLFNDLSVWRSYARQSASHCKMIIPITEEKVWKRALDGLPLWQPPMVPTMILSPHPDDETLGVGGLIAHLTNANVDVRIAAVTDGEKAYVGDRGLGEVREAEQTSALAALGVSIESIYRLRMPDSGLLLRESELIRELMPYAPMGGHVIAPWIGDFHPDHEACGRAARVIAQTRKCALTYYFFWTWHRGTPETLNGLSLLRFPLGVEEFNRRKVALLHHQSQLVHPSGNPILPSNLLLPMERPYEVFLPA